MLKDDDCHFLCNRQVDRRGLKRARELIQNGYVAEWIVDNLPGATSFVTVDQTKKYYAAGFKMGYKDFDPTTGKARYFINNHVNIVIRYRKAPGRDGDEGGKVIVGFEVYTKSIGWRDRIEGCPRDVHHIEDKMELYLPPNNTDKKSNYPFSSYTPPEEEDVMADNSTLNIPYSYSVYFREETKIDWANRWDLYFVNQEDSSKIHWLAILNSLVIAALLTAVVGVILTRTIRGDIKGFGKDGKLEEGKLKLKRKRHSGTKSPRSLEKVGGLLDQSGDAENDADVSSDEDSLEEITGWKLLHADVFRPPPYSGLLAPLVGSGMQLVFMAGGLLILSCLGILNPSFRGGFVSVGVGLFLFAGVFSGYFSGRVYKTFGGQNWKKNTLMVCSAHFQLIYCGFAKLGLDRCVGSRPAIHNNLHSEPVRMGSGVKYCHTVHHACSNGCSLVRHPGTSSLRRKLVWLRTSRRMGASNKDQHYSSSNSCARMAQQRSAMGAPRGSHPIRGHFYRAPLRL